MTQQPLIRRRTAVATALLVGAGLATPSAVFAQAGKSALNLAMVAEPPTLDIQSTPADLVCIIMQHVYEPLFTFDANSSLVPMLAEAMPKISDDGKLYTIALRKGVKLHSGRELNADDVVASLKRWMEVSPRGKSVAAQVADLVAKGPLNVEISLKNAYAPLLSQLAMASGMAAIMAKESLAQPLRNNVQIFFLIKRVKTHPQTEALRQRNLFFNHLARMHLAVLCVGIGLVFRHVLRQQMAPIAGCIHQHIGCRRRT